MNSRIDELKIKNDTNTYRIIVLEHPELPDKFKYKTINTFEDLAKVEHYLKNLQDFKIKEKKK